MTLEEIEEQDDDAFNEFVQAIVEHDAKLLVLYRKTDVNLPPLYRFGNAYKEYWNEIGRSIAASLMPLVDALIEIRKSIDFPKIAQAIQSMAQSFSAWASTIAENMSNVLRTIATSISNLQPPNYSEERKQEMLIAYKKWGTFGWTIFPDTFRLDLFAECPKGINEANKAALNFCKPASIEYLFSQLRTKKIKNSDLNEAIFCYENGQYKACALILFGIIDSQMIRNQPVRDENRRAVGFGAIRVYRERYKTIQASDQTLFLMLICTNVITCLETMFSNGNDFKKEPAVINRNFVSHGMNVRNVRKRDCTQLFLVLHNMTEIIGFLPSIQQK